MQRRFSLPDAGIPKSATEEPVDERVGETVERGEALDEDGEGVALVPELDQPVDIEQVEHKVRTPAEHKCCRRIQKTNLNNARN